MTRWLAGLLLAATAAAVQAAPIDDLVMSAEMNDDRGIRALVAGGVDPNLPDARGRVALFVAAREESVRALEALLQVPDLQVDPANPNGETPLMIAAIRGSLPAVKLLLGRGAALNRAGWTPLHYAASGPDNGVTAWLLTQGAAVDARSPNGTTPLMMAARYGNSLLVPLLLKAGADPALANEQGLTAADFARRGGRDGVARELDALIAARRASEPGK
jgi:ankyrin repeat protein